MVSRADSQRRTYEWYRQTAVEFADRSPSYGALCAAVAEDAELMALARPGSVTRVTRSTPTRGG